MDSDRIDGLLDLTGRVAIVTGGSRGIGKAIAETYAAAGAKVVVASRKADNCDAVARAIRADGGDALSVPTHLGDLDALEALVATTVDRYGGLDILVNNAANALALPVGEITPLAWDKSFNVNLRGPVFLAQFALPHLLASDHAVVINVSSVGAYLFSGDNSMYVAAKAAMMSFTRSMAARYAEQGIRVHTLAPGTVDTDMVRNNPPEVQVSMAQAGLMRRAADPDEIAAGALFLAGDASTFMTGQTLIMDGGLAPR